MSDALVSQPLSNIPENACAVLATLATVDPRDRGALSSPSMFSYEAQILRSAEAGCSLCCVLSDTPKVVLKDEEEIPLDMEVGLYPTIGCGLPVIFKDKFVDVFCEEESTIPHIPHSHFLPGHTGADASFFTAAAWLLGCLSKHSNCSSMSPNRRKLPLRVLDLESQSGQDVLLRETEGISGEYACLSHRWGDPSLPLIKTVTSNLEAHKKRIRFHDFPKTFQDAVTFTRRLTVRYLWIDSLCIIQDSKDDWAVQAGLMSDIYRNALVTLSASASQGPNEGMFMASSPLPDQIRLPPHPSYSNIVIRKRLQHRRERNPLLTRAWVFQERLLSPRVVYFGPEEIMWECMQRRTCECGETRDLPNNADWFDSKSLFHPDVLASLPERLVPNYWRGMVRDYSRLWLTYPGDVFPALGGAAKVWREGWTRNQAQNQSPILDSVVHGDEEVSTGSLPLKDCRYLAGLWEPTFIEDLLWSTVLPERARRPAQWRAPTFSWASVYSPGRGVKYGSADLLRSALGMGKPAPNTTTPDDGHIVEYCAELLHAKCPPTRPDDEFGELEMGAYARTKGPLLKAILTSSEAVSHKASASREQDASSRERLPSLSSLEVEIEDELPRLEDNRHFYPDYDILAPGANNVRLGETVWCMPLMFLLLKGKWRRTYVFFLVLREMHCSDERDGDVQYEVAGLEKEFDGNENARIRRYERIGLMKSQEPTFMPGPPETWEERWGAMSRSGRCDVGVVDIV